MIILLTATGEWSPPSSLSILSRHWRARKETKKAREGGEDEAQPSPSLPSLLVQESCSLLSLPLQLTHVYVSSRGSHSHPKSSARNSLLGELVPSQRLPASALPLPSRAHRTNFSLLLPPPASSLTPPLSSLSLSSPPTHPGTKFVLLVSPSYPTTTSLPPTSLPSSLTALSLSSNLSANSSFLLSPGRILLGRIYEAYSDSVMKNPFHTPEMPIRNEGFEKRVEELVRGAAFGGSGM